MSTTHTKEARAQIGSLITKLREDRGLSQAELGKKTGTTQSVIARIEKGEQNLSTETLAKISAALDREIITIAPSGNINFRIEGGRKLSGHIAVRTSKNGAVGILCASLLNRGTTTMRNVPKIEEVYRIIEVLESIGMKVSWKINANKQNDLELRPPARYDLSKIAAGWITSPTVSISSAMVNSSRTAMNSLEDFPLCRPLPGFLVVD